MDEKTKLPSRKNETEFWSFTNFSQLIFSVTLRGIKIILLKSISINLNANECGFKKT